MTRFQAEGISVRVTPCSGKTGIELLETGVFRVRLRERAVEGKANRALRAFLADFLAVPTSKIEICQGLHSRNKVIRIDGISNLNQVMLATINQKT